jgi:protein tyrosine phosphatase (PTP) superfamily phosphohydrolase (DUF442 family)
LHQLFNLGHDIISGSGPDTDAAFAELAKRGVKVIVSVDGGKPNLELAKKHGLRYIHLPIGYDGIPAQRVAELAKVATEEKVPIYVHCHHGKHRGPAAAAVLLRSRAGWDAGTAEQFLKQAGTAADYAGLYRSVRDFKPPTPEALAKLPAKLPEITPPAPVVDAMVAVDEQFDQLKAAQKKAWKEIPGHPDLKPVQVATLLWENFREQGRLPGTEKQPADYKTKLAAAEKAAAELRSLLGETKLDAVRLDAAMQASTKNCAECHKAHRN